MNNIPPLALFDSGATQSFVSLEFSKRFDDTPKDLDYPLEVEFAEDRPV